MDGVAIQSRDDRQSWVVEDADRLSSESWNSLARVGSGTWDMAVEGSPVPLN